MFRAAILGAPASGKGTIAQRIVSHFDIVHVSSGDLLRQQVRQDTALGKEASKYIEEGKLVPDRLLVELVTSELDQLQGRHWLLDGFPRTGQQAEELFRLHPLGLAINLVVPFSVIIDRVKGRWVHAASGRVYNTDFNAPKVPGRDDITGEPLEQRPDDKPEAVQNRLQIYTDTVGPVLDFYGNHKVLKEFHGKTSDEIWPKVKQTVAKYIALKPKA